MFSEPVWNNVADTFANDFVGQFRVNAGAVALTSATRLATQPNAVLLTTVAPLTNGTQYNVTVNPTPLGANPVRDYAGYQLLGNSSVDFTHTVSTDIPTVTAVARSEKVIRLTFSFFIFRALQSFNQGVRNGNTGDVVFHVFGGAHRLDRGNSAKNFDLLVQTALANQFHKALETIEIEDALSLNETGTGPDLLLEPVYSELEWVCKGVLYRSQIVTYFTIEFNDISGWQRPSSSSITVSANQTVTRTGTYSQSQNQLTFTSLFPTTVNATSRPFDAELYARGSNFNNVDRITFSWSGASGSGSAIWNRGDSNWNQKVWVVDDTRMVLEPRVVGSTATWSGTDYWTITLRDTSGATVSRSFTVRR